MEALNKISQQMFFLQRKWNHRNSKLIHPPCSIKTPLFISDGHGYLQVVTEVEKLFRRWMLFPFTKEFCIAYFRQKKGKNLSCAKRGTMSEQK